METADGIRTEAHDPAKMKDPSLIIYHPVRTMGNALVVTNGNQTDTVCEFGDFRKALALGMILMLISLNANIPAYSMQEKMK